MHRVLPKRFSYRRIALIFFIAGNKDLLRANLIQSDHISSFYQLDKIVKDCLKLKGISVYDNSILSLVGQHYCSFLFSEKKRLTLQLPWYKSSSLSTVVEYLINFDLLFKLSALTEVKNYEGTSLYNVFSAVTRKRHLEFRQKNGDTLTFDHATTMARDRFVPLFWVCQLQERSHDDAILDAFHLFDAIAKGMLLRKAAIIDLLKQLTLVLSSGNILKGERIKTVVVSMTQIKDDNIANVFADIKNLDVTNVITIRYPYHQQIDSRIYKTVPGQVKRFDLVLRERMFFLDVQDHDLILTPAEMLGEKSFGIKTFLGSYKISETEHDKELINSLSELKRIWMTEGFSSYRVPFPSKWLLFINRSATIEWWKKQYQKDFPAVKGNILQLVFKVIEHLYEIDWWTTQEPIITAANVIIPNSDLFPSVVNVLFDHLRPKVNTLHFSNDRTLQDVTETLVCYDAFNSTFILNSDPKIQKEQIQFIVPDFFYYGLSPFFLLFVWDKMSQVRFGGARKPADEGRPADLELNEKERRELRKELVVGLRRYQQRFYEEPVEDLPENTSVLNHADDIADSEIVELVAKRAESVNEDVVTEYIIIATDGTEFRLKGNSHVLLEEMGRLMTAKACLISQHSRFLPIAEISQYVNATHLAERMSMMPKDALQWTVELHKRKIKEASLYHNLKSRGLSILESTFNNSYVSENYNKDNNSFFLPRRYSDWQLICDFLQIGQVAEAWNSHKCRSNLNALREGYIEIIGILFDKGLFGISVDNEVIENVASVLDRISGEYENHTDRHQHAQRLISEITRKIDLKTAKTVKQNP